MNKAAFLSLCVAAVLALPLLPGGVRAADEKSDSAAPGSRFFELRKYTAAPGKLDALQTRFREHTNALFEKHGMTIIGFWVPADGPESKNTLIYILAYPSRAARDQAWKDFQADPDWKKARAESEKEGPLLVKQNPVESKFMTPTDYSPIK